ncbi:MAG: BolA family transcriptional regulator [Synechococcales cyanobacterium]
MSALTDQIHQRLTTTLPGSQITIQDDSHRHLGHAGNTGGGHVAVQIVAEQFQGLSLIQRHRLIYTTLQEWIPSQIHALALTTLTPEERQPATH